MGNNIGYAAFEATFQLKTWEETQITACNVQIAPQLAK